MRAVSVRARVGEFATEHCFAGHVTVEESPRGHRPNAAAHNRLMHPVDGIERVCGDPPIVPLTTYLHDVAHSGASLPSDLGLERVAGGLEISAGYDPAAIFSYHSVSRRWSLSPKA